MTTKDEWPRLDLVMQAPVNDEANPLVRLDKIAVNVELLAARLLTAEQLLRDCSEKLMLYWQRDDAYVGGVEHAHLQERIKNFLRGRP